MKTSIIVVDGDQWQRIRKIVQRSINHQSLDKVIPIMSDSIKKLFAHSDVNKMNTFDLANRTTFDVFHRLIYGWDPNSVIFSQESSKILNYCNIVVEAIGDRIVLPHPILWKIPTKNNRRVDNAITEIKRFVTEFVAKHKESRKTLSNNNLSLLDSMMNAVESEEGGMTNEEVIDQISSLFFAAYDSTSNTLLFMLNYLARNIDFQEKLRLHLFNKFPRRNIDLELATNSDIESILYLTYFVDEVQRLHGFIPIISRTSISETIINNYKIKKGTTILIDTNSVGQEKSFWNGQDDLDKFRPERWVDHTPSIMENVLPFGFGARICPGRKIAICEIKVFIANILCKYKITLRIPEEKLELNMFLGLNLKNGNINFHPL